MTASARHRVVLVGAGFGGLYTALALKRAPVDLTVVDRRNFHLFQPLLYQVATGGLSPGEIASPVRHVLSRQRNTRVWLAEMRDLDVARHEVILDRGTAAYDTLILAAGSHHHYFGHNEWAALAPGLKSIEDATAIRGRILGAFESAERAAGDAERRAWMTFVIVGGGPTGSELAGALAEIARDTLRHDFRNINPADAHIVLVEGADRVLPAFPPDLSAKAERELISLGAHVRTKATVTELDPEGVTVRLETGPERIAAKTVLWAAGVEASELGKIVADRTGAPLDRAGRLVVEPDLTLPGHPEIFVIGDLAHFSHQTGEPLAGLAAVAMAEGRYVARTIRARLNGKTPARFHYFDKGILATIGRNRAVAAFGKLHISGPLAWFVWLFVHLMYLVEFDNRLLVLIEWVYDYITRNRGARLITGGR
ncbi:MAG TPA: NAD(P)/FAD-dependent oxidoreductase [Bryobacteraceae bacterium]|nr:NAD(P)/FAD-dependent oxidoreductase [Bryobacteraceae bacterium]